VDGASETIRVIVADDHPLFLDGVVGTLRATPGFEILGQTTDAMGAVRLAREHLPDLALLDVTMPGNGLQAARDIATACPSTRIVMLTVSEDDDDVLAAMKAGASGYVLKGVSASALVTVLRSVHAGEVYVAPALAWSLLREMAKPRPVDPLAELSSREREVLELVASGLSNQEIGLRLSLAEKTVKHYMTNILSKLQVRSRVEAALLAHRVPRRAPTS
jgi:two-component system, NarL family, nitrate/nitrite response regulator NarL